MSDVPLVIDLECYMDLLQHNADMLPPANCTKVSMYPYYTRMQIEPGDMYPLPIDHRVM